MSKRAQWKFGSVAAGVLAVTAVVAPRLVAQGGTQALRPAAVERSRVEPARSILGTLLGTWRFEIWFAGNIGGPPDASGTRVVSVLFDDLRVQWTEEVDHSPIRGQGFIGFDPRSGGFFSSSLYSTGSGGGEFMTGVLAQGEPVITFSPVATAPGASAEQERMQSSTWSLLDPSHFTVAPLDRGWRAVYTRQDSVTRAVTP
jgi:hypothetical protein